MEAFWCMLIAAALVVGVGVSWSRRQRTRPSQPVLR